jgi:hypothetical protein
MKTTSGLLIAIAAFVSPCTGSLALAQSPQVPTPAQGPARSPPQDQARDNVLAYHGGASPERVNDFGTPCVMRLASKEV